MSAFATLAAVERRLYLDQVATRLGVVPSGSSRASPRTSIFP